VQLHIIEGDPRSGVTDLSPVRSAIDRYRLLDHPSLPPVLDVDDDGVRLVVSTPRIDGVRLDRVRKLLRNDRADMPEPAVWFIGWRLFGALAVGHMARDPSGLLLPIVHGSLAMTKMSISRSGELMVLGLCPWLDVPDEDAEEAGASQSVVPQAWWAPEVRLGHTAHPPSDVYSGALILRTLLAGAPQPVPGELLRPLVELRPDLPHDVTEALDRAVARNGDDAPTAADLTLRFEGLVRVSAGKRALDELVALQLAIRGLFSVATPEDSWRASETAEGSDPPPASDTFEDGLILVPDSFEDALLEALPLRMDETSPESIQYLDEATSRVAAEVDGIVVELEAEELRASAPPPKEGGQDEAVQLFVDAVASGPEGEGRARSGPPPLPQSAAEMFVDSADPDNRRDSAAPIELMRLASPVLSGLDELDPLDATLDDTQPDLERPSDHGSAFLMPSRLLHLAQDEIAAQNIGATPRVLVEGHFEVAVDPDADDIGEEVARVAPRKQAHRTLAEARQRRGRRDSLPPDSFSDPPLSASSRPADVADDAGLSRWGLFAAVAISTAVAAWYGSKAADVVESIPDNATPVTSVRTSPPSEPASALPLSTVTTLPSAPLALSGAPPDGASEDELKSFEAFLVITSSADAEVVLKGQPVGYTNQKNRVRCGAFKHVRLRRRDIGDATAWLTKGESIAVPCMQTTTHRIEPGGTQPFRGGMPVEPSDSPYEP
jgi:hypothetical protein